MYHKYITSAYMYLHILFLSEDALIYRIFFFKSQGLYNKKSSVRRRNPPFESLVKGVNETPS